MLGRYGRPAVQLFGLAASAGSGFLLLLFATQRNLIYLPSRQVYAPQPRPGTEGYIVRDDSFAAFWMPPVRDGAPVVVFWHGNADQVGLGSLYVGTLLQQRYGCGVFMVEYPGYGIAQAMGAPTEASIYESSDAAIRHLIAPVDHGGLGVSGDRVVLMGQSIGCAPAMEMAQRGFARSGLVLVSPFMSIKDMSKRMFGTALVDAVTWALPFILRDRMENLQKARTLQLPPDTPAIVVHGEQDLVVPFSQGRAVSAALPSHTLFTPVPDAGHNDLFVPPHLPTVLRAVGHVLGPPMPQRRRRRRPADGGDGGDDGDGEAGEDAGPQKAAGGQPTRRKAAAAAAYPSTASPPPGPRALVP